MVGLFSAWYLLKSGYRVRVLDDGRPGQASWAAGGILSPLYPWTYPRQVQRMAAASQAQYADIAYELQAITAVDVGYERSGMLVLDHLQQGADWCTENAVSFELWGQQKMRQVLPHGSPAVVAPDHDAALFLPDVAQVRPPRLLKALRAVIQALGGVVENASVERLEIDQSRVAAVVTSAHQKLSTDQLVICAGCWSNQLVETDEIPMKTVRPVKGQMLLYSGAEKQSSPIILSAGRYLVPRPDGLILAGSSLEDAGFSSEKSDDVKKRLQEFVSAIDKNIAKLPIKHHWAGLRPATEDGIPCVEKSIKINNLLFNYGHYRHGVTTAPASAQRLVDLLSDKETEEDDQ